MTNIHTLKQPEKRAKVEVSMLAEFRVIESFKADDLRVWLDRLPKNARVSYEGISNGNIRLVAKWKEMR